MKEKRKYIFLPFPILLLSIVVIAAIILNIFNKNDVNIFNVLILILCFSIFFIYKVVIICNGKYESNSYFFFIRFNNKKIKFNEVKEIILKKEEKNITVGKSSTSKALYTHVERKKYILLIINSNDEPTSICESSKYQKIYGIAIMFSKFFKKPIKDIEKYSDLTDYDNIWLP